MIRSRRNPRITELARLHRARHRKQTGRALLEGPHLLSEALAAGEEILEVLALSVDVATRALCERRGIPLTPVSGEVLARVAGTKNPRGPVAVLSIPNRNPQGKDVFWLLVSEPGNCGTLIRTASAFGWDVAMGGGSVDPWSPKVLRAAAGGHFGVAIGQAAEAPVGAMVVAAVPRGGVPLSEVYGHLDQDRQWWLVIGDEAQGISPVHADRADVWCSIPMSGGVESLNAAVAGAIICHHLSRLRVNRKAGPMDLSGELSKLL